MKILRPLLPWLLLVAVAGFYARSASFDLIYDDEIVIKAQPQPKGLSDFARIFAEQHFPGLPYYRPVTRLTLLAQKAVHGDRPGAYHLFNAILMGVGAAAGYVILRGEPFLVSPMVAFAAAGLFSIHPAVSSVVYPISSGRETLLPAVFMFGALLFFFRRGRWSRPASFLMFSLALFSKEQAVVLPLALVLGDALGLGADGPGRKWRKWLARYSPHLAALLVYFAVRGRLFGGQEMILHVARRPLDFLLSYIYAVQTVFVPFFKLVYEPPVKVWFSPVRLILSLAVLGLFLVVCIKARKTLGRRLLFWAGWFFLMQLATANILRQEAQFEERYVFAAMFGFWAAAALIVDELRHTRSAAVLALLLSGALLIFYVLAGSARADAFRDSYHFHRRWQESNPESAIAQANYGLDLMKRGEMKDARRHLEAALRIRTTDDALGNLGVVLLALGSPEEAVGRFREAVRLNPGKALSRTQLGFALEQTGDLGAAEQEYRAALEIKPQDARSHANLGYLLARTGRLPEAITHLEAARKGQPEDVAVMNGLGRTYLEQGMFDRALGVIQEVLRLDPANPAALSNAAQAHAGRGDPGAAAELYKAAVARQPDDPRLLTDYAWLLAGGVSPDFTDVPKAIRLAARACELSLFRDCRALFVLSRAQAAAGRLAEAAQSAEKALPLCREAGEAGMTGELERARIVRRAGRP